MAEHTLTWVGDKVHDYKDKRTYSVAVRDPQGQEHKKVKLEMDQSAPAPEAGDTLDGGLQPHPRFDDAKLFVVGGETSTAKPSGGRITGGDNPDTRKSIERQTAYKGAAEVVSAMVAAGQVKADTVPNVLRALTDIGAEAIAGGKAKAEQPKQEDSPKAEADSDIPF